MQNRCKRILRVSLLVSLLFSGTGILDRIALAGQEQEVLTNETITTLVKAGLSPSIIVSKINSSKTNFDVSTAELLRLKQANVPDEIINAMIQAGQSEAQQRKENAKDPALSNPDDPLAPHEAGIYAVREEDGRRRLVQLEPSIYKQSKSGGFLTNALTYGIAKVKSRAVLAGETANLQFDAPRPVFYWYFEVKNAGLSNSGNFAASSTSPNEFVLAKMDIKKNSREVVVAEFNSLGAQSGALDKYSIEFGFEKLAPGVYRVTPRTDLADGQYCFYYGGSTPPAAFGWGGGGGGKVFDFGVKIGRKL